MSFRLLAPRASVGPETCTQRPPMVDLHLPVTLAYVGPDVFLPLTSALAAVAGVALMFWHRILSVGRKVWQVVARRKE
jgi:hypothetical protein